MATGRYPYTGRFGIVLGRGPGGSGRGHGTGACTGTCKDQDFTRDQRWAEAADHAGPGDLSGAGDSSYWTSRRLIWISVTSWNFLSVLQEMKRKKKLTVIMSLHEIELAEIISDQILCIREHRVDRMGTPAEVLDKGYIAKLFDITAGSYEETTGNVELPAPRGDA